MRKEEERGRAGGTLKHQPATLRVGRTMVDILLPPTPAVFIADTCIELFAGGVRPPISAEDH